MPPRRARRAPPPEAPLSPYRRNAVPSPTSTEENVSDDDESEVMAPVPFSPRAARASGNLKIGFVIALVAMLFSVGINMTTTTSSGITKNSEGQKIHKIPGATPTKQNTEIKKRLPADFQLNHDVAASSLTTITQLSRPTVAITTSGGIGEQYKQTTPCFVLLSSSDEAFTDAANRYNLVYGQFENEKLTTSPYWDANSPIPTDPRSIQTMLLSVGAVCGTKKRCNVRGSYYVGANSERYGKIVYKVDVESGAWVEQQSGEDWDNVMRDIVIDNVQ